ncbi:MAG: acetyl-CoA carboxylase biotin carboxyl carrier protein subunit [Endomicrobiia bacterium]
MATLEELKKYLEFLSTTDIEEIEIQSPDGEKIFLKRNKISSNNVISTFNKLQKEKSLQIESKQELDKEFEHTKESLKKEFIIRSPMVGRFLLSVSQDHPPFIVEGSQIKQGQKIAVIETMRILRDVLSPQSGVVKKILVKDGEFVEYGQPLVILEILQGETL